MFDVAGHMFMTCYGIDVASHMFMTCYGIDVEGHMFMTCYGTDVTGHMLMTCYGIDVAGHMFMTCYGTRDERVRETLGRIGPAVLSGGFSTFLAFSLLSASSSSVFITFFKVTCM